MSFQTGIVEMSNDEYFDIETPGVTRSGLEKIRRSPAHYAARFHGDYEDDSTPAMVFGNVLHCMALEPEFFESRYVFPPEGINRRTKAGKIEYVAWLEGNLGRTVISKEDFCLAVNMVDAVLAHPTAAQLMESTHREITAQWIDPEYREQCRCRVDLYDQNRGFLTDLKTTTDASPAGFAKSCASFGYHRQHAYYLDGLKAAGLNANVFAFIAVEKKPPFAVGVYVLDEAAVDLGRKQIQDAMRIYSQCMATGRWPGYSEHPQPLELPRWAFFD